MVTPPVAQILKCPNCSAPLEAPLGGGIVHCGYCRLQVNVQPGNRSPAPQPQYPFLPQTRPSGAGGQAVAWIVGPLVLIGMAMVVVSVFAVGSFTKPTSNRSSPTIAAAAELLPSRLKEIKISQTSAQLAAWAGVKVSAEERLELRLKGSRFDSLVFYWRAPNAQSITEVSLHARAPIAKGDFEPKTASAVLGARFANDPHGGTTFESNGVRFAINDRQVELRVWPEKHPNWQRQMAVLWQLALALVLQEPVQIDPATRRDVLGTGYPLRSLSQVNQAIDVDQSESHVKALFPGVARHADASGLHYVVPLDNPWFREAGLIWKNEKGGTMVNARLDPPPFVERFTNQLEIRDCLARRFGAAKDAEINHLANDHSYQWQKYWPHASVYAGSTYLWLEIEDARRALPVNLKAVVEALADCTVK